MDEATLRAELAALNRQIPIDAALLDRKRERRDQLQGLFAEKVEEPVRVVQKSFAIGA